MNTQGIVGAMCVDNQGLCLGAKGCAQKDSAGSIAIMVQQAAKLCPSSSETPVISLESEAGNILIKSHEDITMAVYKSPS